MHEGEIVWNPPSTSNVIIASSPKILAEEGLESGQKVVLLLKSILEDSPKIVLGTYDDFLEKVSSRDAETLRIIRELAFFSEVDRVFYKTKS